MPLTPLIHITAAYSNAVLVAILPHVNDFAKKMDLPIPLPITTNQVKRFNVARMKGEIGGGLWLTNHYQFVFADGCVSSFKSLEGNPFLSQDPAQDWPHYLGKDNMTTNDAIEMARGTLRKLGYDPKALHADTAPFSVEGSYDLREGHFPYCQIRWDKEAQTEKEKEDAAYLVFQINMEDKTIVGMTIIGRKIWQTNPVVDVVTETEGEYRQRTQGKKQSINTNAPYTQDVMQN
jgi:hypothetical protein